ncbi:TonB family protein [Litoribrevibacter albus]|uniref:TonB C-terminal domain-containing protein n=1 Tax=Litoribrevibacter albus TaxID=1473156 RepID=A0AA37S9G1_9GAMM|nr:TonB family protein [Litoribrevibacter albus]GLQ30693.1 hypothetical protein GCM10007876_11720 [Litoribrevibacter albus]
MRKSHLRLTLTLLLALIGHVVFLYPTPELIPIPLKEPTYSVEVQLTSEKASSNSREESEDDNKDQIETTASEESKKENDHLEEQSVAEHQEQAGSENAELKEESSQAEVKVVAPKPAETKADSKTTHHLNTPTKQLNESPPKRVEGVQTSDVEKSPKPTKTNKEVTVSDIASSKEKEASEANKASNQKSVKSEEAIQQPELTATEQYETQIYAWILNGPSASIYAPTEGIRNPPTIEFTWWRNGTIILAKVKKSSGDPATDLAAKRSVLSASPLPKIPDHITGKEYTLEITFAQSEK